MNITLGAQAAAAWLRDRGDESPTTPRWYVEIAFDVATHRAPSNFDEATATRFHLNIYAEEWGVFFCHAGRASWIRVTDIAFVHGRDDFGLLRSLPPLNEIGSLVRMLEEAHRIALAREHATIATNLERIEPAIRTWITRM